MGTRVKESGVQSKIRKYLESIPGSRFEKRVGTVWTRDRPDLSGCIRGRRIEIEVKAPGKKPTPKQREELDKWEAAGAVVVRGATSVEEVRLILETTLNLSKEETS